MIDSTNPRILANHIRKLWAKVNGIVPGTEVEGNPSGSGFNTLLTKIKIGSHKYKLPADVAANPEGEATGSLTKLGIGSGIYSIPVAQYSATQIFDGSSGAALQTSIELSQEFDGYDALCFIIKFAGDGSTLSNIVLKEHLNYALTNEKILGFGAFASAYAGGKISSDKKTFTNIYGSSVQNIVAVYGLKF